MLLFCTSEEEIERVRKLCREFLTGIGPKLQELLYERQKKQRNWLDGVRIIDSYDKELIDNYSGGKQQRIYNGKSR